ncbi:MAG TPA: hypothetical protein VFX84_03335 [Candidatus Saccharimonadales bacterium]|nr:hypothetical protein [Candidatus Saccharimonadales bacterium]
MKAKIPRNFDNLKKLRPRRAGKPSLGAMLAVLAVSGGVAFALLQSHASLTGNSVTTGTAGLLISPNDTNYSNTYAGFSFSGIVPGMQASQTEHFLLKNTGTTPLAIRFGVTSTPANPSGIDLSKVHVMLAPYSTETYMPTTPLDFTLQSLVEAGDAGVAVEYPSMLSVGMKEEYNVRIAMDADAVDGNSASLSGIDFGFTGVAAAN